MRPRPSAALVAIALALPALWGCVAADAAAAAAAAAPAPAPAAPDVARLLADEDVWRCARGPGLGDALTCLEGRATALLQAGLDREEETARKNGELPLLEKMADLGAQLMPDAAEALVSTDADEEADDADAESRSANDVDEGRGKKKKKKKALMKLMFVAMLIKNKLGLLFQGFSALLQIKFFGLAVLQLLLTLFRLYLDLAKKKEPQKVIYYEHAQHQHHYEHEHHYDDDKGGWGLWGRSYDEAEGAPPAPARPDAHQQAYNSYLPRSAA